jgi:hypothetical protein
MECQHLFQGACETGRILTSEVTLALPGPGQGKRPERQMKKARGFPLQAKVSDLFHLAEKIKEWLNKTS